MLRANVIAQIVVLLSTPILSRLYSPEVFGQFAFFSAATALAVSVATFRFDWSIPNARTVGAAAALMRIGIMCILGTSLALITFLGFSIISGYELFPESGIGHTIFLLPLAMISSSLIELFNGWYVRVGNLETVGRVKIVHSLSNTVLSVLGGLAKLGTAGMIGASIVSACVGVTMFFVQTARIHRDIARAGKRRMAATFRRFRREAALSTAVSLTNALSATASIFLIAAFFTLQELGWYALMQRLALLPVGLISASIGASFWATAAVLARQGAFVELRSLHLRTTKRLSLAIIPIAIGCAAAPFVIGPLFGSDEWTPAGYVLLAMAPQIIGTAVFAPTNHLIVYGKQSYQLASDIFAMLLTVMSVYVAAQWNLGIILCTLLVSSSLFLGYVVRFWLHLHANSVVSNERR